jgi:hypothetical protein
MITAARLAGAGLFSGMASFEAAGREASELTS